MAGLTDTLGGLAGQDKSMPGSPSTAVVSLRPGTRLMRSWNGETYSVLVTDNGYNFNNQTFTSLNRIAQAITGTKWSGPRFFGLKTSVPAKGGRDA